MVKCLDSLSSQQTRLVIIVDGLDSCEQDKVLLILDTVHMLFSDANSPFIVILAIDPHVIAKVSIQVNASPTPKFSFLTLLFILYRWLGSRSVTQPGFGFCYFLNLCRCSLVVVEL